MIFLCVLSLSLFSTVLCQVKDAIICPCGKTGANFTTFPDEELQDDPCLKFRNCATCRNNTDRCLSCPKDYLGTFCTTLLDFKRNDHLANSSILNVVHLLRKKRHHACPDFTRMKLVDITCWIGPTDRECTGTCAPGHHFQNRRSSEITLKCKDGAWTPMTSFPQCVSEGHCDLQMIRPGLYNCTTGSRGTTCEIFCYGQYTGKYSCFPGSGWKSELPSCIRPKVRRSGSVPANRGSPRPQCRCENGGMCNTYFGTCSCPPGYNGRYCEIDNYAQTAFCSDPGQIPNGHRHENAVGSSPTNGLYEEGSTISFMCNSGYVISATDVMTCLDSGYWSAEAPTCRRKPSRTPTRTTTRRPPSDDYPGKVFCNDPGHIVNGHRHEKIPENGLYEEGFEMIYMCDPGYDMSGPEILTCNDKGSWSPARPTCHKSETPSHEEHSHEANTHEEHSHETPSRPLPPKVLPPKVLPPKVLPPKVLPPKKPPPVSQMCEDPGQILNGRKEAFTTQFTEGAVVSYYCNEGYILDGDSNLICHAEGRWSSQKPICRAKIRPPPPITPTSGTQCRSTGVPINSEVKLYEAAGAESQWMTRLRQKEFPAGTRIRYKCLTTFYKLYGSEYQTCQSSGIWSGYKPACTPDCGKSDAPKTPQIINGSATEIGQWPWQVAIYVFDSRTNRPELSCGGSLLNERWVLTAAHCVTAENSDRPLERSAVTIFVGKYYSDFNKDDQFVQERKVQQFVVHENYDHIRYDSDIALIELVIPVELSVRVQPICLPTDRSTRENIRDDQLGTITGWGRTERDLPSDILLKALLPVVLHKRCEESYRKKHRAITVTDNMFCAGYKDGWTDSCPGDSGGPMMFLEESQRPHRWIIEGIVSWGIRDGCGRPDSFSGFVKVHQFLDWIKMTI